MKLAAARAITDRAPENELGPEHILSPAFTEGIADRVAKALRSLANKEA